MGKSADFFASDQRKEEERGNGFLFSRDGFIVL